MVKYYLAIALFFVGFSTLVYAQSTFTATYKPINQDARTKVMETYAQSYQTIEGKIENLSKTITDALAQDVDTLLRRELNSDYSELERIKEKLERDGDISSARISVSSIGRIINGHILQYNNRVAQAREAAEIASVEKQTRIEEESKKPKFWTGTCFALKNGYIVTNYHVVENAREIKIKGVNGDFSKPYLAIEIAADKVNDLAILQIIDTDFKSFGTIPYSIKTGLSEVGEDIFVLGFPLAATMGEEIKYTNGSISSRTGFQGDVSLYQISAPIQPGNSGGPLFDSKGNLIGIISAKHQGAENVGYAVKATYLMNLIESSSIPALTQLTNSISALSRPDQIKAIKKFVYYIECSNGTTVSSTEVGSIH